MANDADPVTGKPELVVVVLLAAGAGSRFSGHGHKLAATVEGRSIGDRALSSARASGVGPVVVVTGATRLPLADQADDDPSDLHIVDNPDWADGQSTSLRVAVTEAERLGADAIVVGLADQPFIEPEAWRRVAAARSPIAVATYDGKRRNPVRLHRDVWPLLPTSGDEGARSVIRLRADLVSEVPCPGSPADIDTLEDLRTWQNRSSTNSP